MFMQPAGYRIAASCPGCGAAVDFGADFFVTKCIHCHSPLRLLLPHNSAAFFFKATLSEREQRFAIDRFCKVNGESLPSGLRRSSILFPYWNVDGILLKVRNEIERREIVSEFGDENANEVVETPRQRVTLTPFSTTIPAGDINEGIPSTIGLRAKYVTLNPLAADKLETGVTLVQISHSAEDAIEQASRVSRALSQVATPDFGKNSNQLFPLSASLIFFPYAIFASESGSIKRSFVVDLLSGDVTKADSKGKDENDVFDTAVQLSEAYQVRLSFHRCPNCGNDLPQEQSLVYICAQCEERVTVENGIPKDVQISFVQSGVNYDDTWFPFWILAGSETRVMPAFRSGNYEAMFRLSQRMTGALPKLQRDSIAKGGNNAIAPVQVSIEEAMAMFQAGFARQSVGKSAKAETTFSAGQNEAAELLFVPFHKEEYFYIDSCLKVVTFEQAVVKMNGREPAVKSRV